MLFLAPFIPYFVHKIYMKKEAVPFEKEEEK